MQVLVFVEDNPGDALIIQEYLTDEAPNFFSVERYEQLQDGLQRIEKGDVDVVLLDLFLPDSRGLETFYRVHNTYPEIPVVIVSSLNDQELALEAVRAGAQDFLVKGQFTAKELVKALFYAIARNEARKATETIQQVTKTIGKLTKQTESLQLDTEQISKAVGGINAENKQP